MNRGQGQGRGRGQGRGGGSQRGSPGCSGSRKSSAPAGQYCRPRHTDSGGFSHGGQGSLNIGVKRQDGNGPREPSGCSSVEKDQISQNPVDLVTDNEMSRSSTPKLDMTLEQSEKDSGRTPIKGPETPVGSDGKSNNSHQPFDICLIKGTNSKGLKPSLLETNKEKRRETQRSMEPKNRVELRKGMVLLRGYISLSDQIKIVKRCRDLGVGPGGFYQPGYRDGAKLNLNMMCLGKNWDPETRSYGDQRPSDGAKPPTIPKEFYQLVQQALKDSHSVIEAKSGAGTAEKQLPWMTPDICIVNFYTSSGRLGLHQDRDESLESIRKGLPVVSFSIGDSAEFLYGDQRDVDKAEKVVLESGDVLIFGGDSRSVFHGVSAIQKETAPKTLLAATNLRLGRLNLTFRQF